VHHHRVHADQLEQHHIAGEALLQRFGSVMALPPYLMTMVLSMEALDVGQGLGDDLGLVGGGELARST
jgi:hypothetical protein